jgi:hypothetical protein
MSGNSVFVTGPIGRLRGARRSWSAPAVLAVAGLIAVAGCGDDDKPAYCSDRSNLEDSIQGLPSAASGGDVDGLRSQLRTIQSDAKTLTDSAKSDFPTETNAIDSAVNTLEASVDSLPANPSASDLRPAATDAAAVVTSVENFSDATNSECD